MNWAVVIGIDKYWTEAACLKGAVRDALCMRKWLLDPAGGNVPEENMALLLTPLEGKDPGVEDGEATNEGIVKAIADVLKRSGGEGERLYFFYAGHGLTARINQRDESTLVAADFSDILTTNSLALRSLWEFFETVQFKDQYFFVDACRNMPWENVEFEVGRWPLPRKRDPGLPPAQQFILYATSPGLRAQELQEAGNERGAFTEVLLDGLRGKSKAKAWSAEKQNYQVRWERLVDYVKNDLEERRVDVGQGAAQDVFQIPQDTGAHGVAGRERNPVLAEFPADAFDPEPLRIVLSPDEAVSVAEVIVLDEAAVPVETKPAVAGPVEFTLPPRTYALHATAPDYDRAVARPPIELYSPCEIPLELAKAVAAEAAEAAEAAGNGAATRGMEGAPAPGGEAGAAPAPAAEAAPAAAPPAAEEEAATATLVVRTGDRLAPIEVADASGRVLTVANGEAVLRDTAPGFYRVRLIPPGGAFTEELVEVAPGTEEVVELEATVAAPVVQELVETIAAPVHEDGTVEISESAGRVAAPELSTLLTLAAGAVLGDGSKDGDALGRLGLGTVTEALPADAESGLYVVLGLPVPPAEAKGYWQGLKLRLWKVGEPVPEETQTVRAADAAQVAEFACSAAPGPYWLSLEPPGGKPMVIALSLLPKRLALLTIELDPALAKIFQYLPALAGDSSASAEVLRKVELLERIMLDGRLDAGADLAGQLLARELNDPLAGCLSAYLYIRLGRTAELEATAKNLTTRFPGLSDAHVIRGEYEAHAGRAAEAKEAFTKAIEAGIPLFGEGLTKLLEGLRTYELEHPLAKLVRHIFKGHMSGSMWSVWVPDELKPGAHLVP